MNKVVCVKNRYCMLISIDKFYNTIVCSCLTLNSNNKL